MKKKKLVSRPQDQILEGGATGGGFSSLKGFTGGKKELFKSPAQKVRSATTAAVVASKVKEVEDDWDILNREVFEKPYLDRIQLKRWGRGNLVVHDNQHVKFSNGEMEAKPIVFYHGSPTMVGTSFVTDYQSNNEGKPYGKRDDGYFGSGISFTTDFNDAVVYKESKDENLNEIRPTEISEIRKTTGGLYEPEVVGVYLAPENPLYIAVYGRELGFVRDPQDYKNIVSATLRVIERETKGIPEKQREILINSFHHKVIEIANSASIFMTPETSINEKGEFGLDFSDTANLLPGMSPKFPEETWRWKFRHPTRRGELNMEELSSFIKSGDFTEIAREAGYTASMIQWHPDSTKVQNEGDDGEFNMEDYHEVLIYGKKQIKGIKNRGSFDDTEDLNTQYIPNKPLQVA